MSVCSSGVCLNKAYASLKPVGGGMARMEVASEMSPHTSHLSVSHFHLQLSDLYELHVVVFSQLWVGDRNDRIFIL